MMQKSISADPVETWPLARLKPYERNARKHSPAQLEQLRRSFREFGQVWPLLVREDGTLIAGHGRLEAAKAEGLTEVRVLVARGWSEERCRAFTLLDNKVALNSEWDENLLGVELAELNVLGLDPSLMGFDPKEFEKLTAAGHGGNTDPDAAPDPPADPVSRLGDVWLLGRHRLVCGDCTEADTVVQALNGVQPHLMVTDPPYGVEYNADWRNHALRADGSPIAGRAIGKVKNDDRADWREAWALFPGDVAYCWHAGRHASNVQASLEAVGFDIRCQIIWAKSRFAIGRGDYHWQHEPCWYVVRKGRKGHWFAGRDQTTLWEISHVKSETGHSTQKPVECMKRPIENNSSPGQAVYDPFLGSGTTLIAAEMTGRACHAIELSPAYVDVTVRRWQDFAGAAATLEGDGRSFAEIAAERISGGAVDAAPPVHLLGADCEPEAAAAG